MKKEEQVWNICQLNSISGWLLNETNDERAARLEHLAAETDTDDEREARMQGVAALVQQRRDLDERLPLHEQHHVQAAMH